MSRIALLAGVIALFAMACPANAAAETDFSATWVTTGDSFSLDQLDGEVVLLNLWATWCEPCKREMPELGAIADEFSADGLQVIGVNIDRTVSDAGVIAFANEHGAHFGLVRDNDNSFSAVFKSSGVPETVLIDRNGDVAYHWKGELQARSSDTRQIIRETLSGETSGSPSNRIATVGYLAAFGAGVLSLFSPCVFPLLPTYAAWITGVSSGESTRRRQVMLRNGCLFVAGFSLVFIALGASASALGGAVHEYRDWIGRIGGLVLLGFGLHMLGVFRIAALDRIVQPRFERRATAGSGFGTFTVGVAFGASWTPCIGPILASILTVAASSVRPGQGVVLLAVYSLGLAVPFLLCTLFIERFMARRAGVARWIPAIERISGVMIVAVGILMISGLFSQMASYASRFDPLI